MRGPDTITAQALIESARALVGTPYQHQGRSQWGVDCIGLVALAASNAGLDLVQLTGYKDSRDYSRRADPEFLAMTTRHLIAAPALIPGAVIFLRFGGRHREEHPRHYALYTEAGTIIHAHAPLKRVVEHGYRAPWPAWQHSIWRLPGVRYE